MSIFARIASLTHSQPVGWGGLLIVALGCFAPPIAEHFWPNLHPDTVSAIKDFARYVELFGAGGALLGKGPLSTDAAHAFMRNQSPAAQGAQLAQRDK